MRRSLGVGTAVLAVAVLTIVFVILGRDGGPDYERTVAGGVADFDYVIPSGTADRLRRHERVDLLPERLDVEVGQTIRIRNDDTTGQLVGIFYVGPGETVRMRFTAPGTLSGTCQVHPDGRFTIAVHDA